MPVALLRAAFHGGRLFSAAGKKGIPEIRLMKSRLEAET